MTRRKPPGVSRTDWFEALVGEARDRGDFDRLPGKGKPLRVSSRPWVDEWAEREGVKEALPAALELQKEARARLGAILQLETEAQVRAAVKALNQRIGKANATMTHGPPSRVAPLDVDDVVQRWRLTRR